MGVTRPHQHRSKAPGFTKHCDMHKLVFVLRLLDDVGDHLRERAEKMESGMEDAT
jgi:hypothetical protein